MAKTSEERTKDRSGWPVRRFKLGDELSDDLTGFTTAVERLAMVEELSEQAWALSGREFPEYERADAPGRVLRSRR